MRLHAQTEVVRKMHIESEVKLSYLRTHTHAQQEGGRGGGEESERGGGRAGQANKQKDRQTRILI